MERVWLTSNLHLEMKTDRVDRRQVDQPPSLLRPVQWTVLLLFCSEFFLLFPLLVPWAHNYLCTAPWSLSCHVIRPLLSKGFEQA